MLLIARVQRRHGVYQILCFTSTCCGGLGRFGALRRFGALTRFDALRRFDASTRYSTARDLLIHQVKCRRSQPLWRFFACGALKLWRLETLWRFGAIWHFDALALFKDCACPPFPVQWESGNRWHYSVFDPCVMTTNWLQALPRALDQNPPLEALVRGWLMGYVFALSWSPLLRVLKHVERSLVAANRRWLLGKERFWLGKTWINNIKSCCRYWMNVYQPEYKFILKRILLETTLFGVTSPDIMPQFIS